MPKQKDLKRRVRARMQKTGESYTAARAKLVAKKSASVGGGAAGTGTRLSGVVLPEERYAEVAGMSDEAVRKGSGRTWRQWARVLDAAGAARMPHREIAAILRHSHEVPAWWSQMVTVGYERIRGLRQKGQRRDGTFEVNKSKTVRVPVDRLYRAFSEKRRRQKWLPDAGIEVRTSRRNTSIRLAWHDGSPVEARFVAKGDDKSQVSIEHGSLPTKAAADDKRRYWTERLEALADLFAGVETG